MQNDRRVFNKARIWISRVSFQARHGQTALLERRAISFMLTKRKFVIRLAEPGCCQTFRKVWRRWTNDGSCEHQSKNRSAGRMACGSRASARLYSRGRPSKRLDSKSV